MIFYAIEKHIKPPSTQAVQTKSFQPPYEENEMAYLSLYYLDDWLYNPTPYHDRLLWTND